MKIIIAGAGIGGMTAAENLGKLGFEVTVYEKSPSLEEMRYDWHDDVSPAIFRRLGIDIPEGAFPKRSWTFVAPFGDVVRGFKQSSEPDLSVDRRKLNEILFRRAEPYARFEFGASVTAPIVAKNRVIGVVVNGEEVLCDLVVDSLGVDSPLKAGLPREFRIGTACDNEIFEVYRAFYSRAANCPDPQYTDKVYLKHLDEDGISWVVLDHDPTMVNVLVGRIGGLEKEVMERALKEMKRENPIIGDEIVKGGIVCRIPVRYPATRAVAGGYAAVGDSAFMTIPMLGSGIASSMLAGFILGETVGANMSNGKKGEALFNLSNLWKYQVRCFREFGAEHCAADVLKRWMLKQEKPLIDWILGSELMTDDDLSKIAGGGMLRLSAADVRYKIKKAGIKKLGYLMKMNKMLSRSKRAYRIGKNIPRNYNDNIVSTWEYRLKNTITRT